MEDTNILARPCIFDISNTTTAKTLDACVPLGNEDVARQLLDLFPFPKGPVPEYSGYRHVGANKYADPNLDQAALFLRSLANGYRPYRYSVGERISQPKLNPGPKRMVYCAIGSLVRGFGDVIISGPLEKLLSDDGAYTRSNIDAGPSLRRP